MEERARGDRQMFTGEWKCAECGKEITELPFEPKEGQTISCKECYLAKRPKRTFSRERQMVQGSWKCSDCGKTITELPFEPAQGKPVFCRDCFRNNRPPRRSF